MRAFRIVLVFLFFQFHSVGAPDDASAVRRDVFDVSVPTDVAVTAGALLTSVVPYAFADKLIDPRCPCPTSEINGFDRGVVGNRSDGALVATDVILGTSLIVPIVADAIYLGGMDDVFWEDALVYVQTLSVAGALVSLSKVIFQRPLPRTYAGDPDMVGNPRGYRSFYSGHVTMTVASLTAAATTMHFRGNRSPWPWIGVGALGLSVAIGRVAGGVHFYTDVLVGAAVGAAVGYLVPRWHRGGESRSAWFLLPQNHGALAVYSLAL